MLDRIERNDAALGDFFSRCIKMGYFCSYQPDPDFPIAWEFAATVSQTQVRLSSQQSSRPQVAMQFRRAPIVRKQYH